MSGDFYFDRDMKSKLLDDLKPVLDCLNSSVKRYYDFSKINNIDVPYQITNRRPGDIDACYADPEYALKSLNWKANKGINEMCKDAYNYVIKQKNDI